MLSPMLKPSIKYLNVKTQVKLHVSLLVTFSTTHLPLLSIFFGEIKSSGPD